MKRLIEILTIIWKTKDIREKILYTLLCIAAYRLLSFIVLPGIDPERLSEHMRNLGGIASLLNAFAGGAFARASITALGVMPYISASIIMQLMSVAFPAIQRLQKEGEYGRRKINEWTRYLTVAVCLVQAPGYLQSQIPTEALTLHSKALFLLNTILLTVGSLVSMWLGEKITDRGIGNGISILITVGIIVDFPTALAFEFETMKDKGGIVLFVAEILLWLAILMFIILVVQGVRKIPIQFTRRVVSGGEIVGGARQFLPIKVNAAGVMPIVFAQAIMFLPYTIIGISGYVEGYHFLSPIFDIYGFWHNLILLIFVIIFTYFYTAILYSPQQIGDELKKSGGFIPGIKPGSPTINFIDRVITRVTLPGAILLGMIALLPAFMHIIGISSPFARFFGGTSILIVVGVMLDTLQQLESNILMHQYETIIKGEKIKGRIFQSV